MKQLPQRMQLRFAPTTDGRTACQYICDDEEERISLYGTVYGTDRLAAWGSALTAIRSQMGSVAELRARMEKEQPRPPA